MYVFHSGISINGPLVTGGDAGSAGEVLTSAGSGSPPTWGAGAGASLDALDANLTGSDITTLTAGDPIIFNTVNYDPNTSYDNTTGLFTCAYAGIYLLTTSVTISNTALFAHQTQIRVNGVAVTSQSSSFTPSTYCNSCSIVIELAANDVVKVCLNETIGSGGGTGVTILYGSTTRFGIFNISK